MRSRLVIGSSPGRAGKRTLSRLVSFRVRPENSHSPFFPNASSPASSVFVGGFHRAFDRPPRTRRGVLDFGFDLGLDLGLLTTSSLVRPVFTDWGCSSGSQPGSEWSSFL